MLSTYLSCIFGIRYLVFWEGKREDDQGKENAMKIRVLTYSSLVFAVILCDSYGIPKNMQSMSVSSVLFTRQFSA